MLNRQQRRFTRRLCLSSKKCSKYKDIFVALATLSPGRREGGVLIELA